MPLLGVTIHAIAVDQRGHGDAGKPKVGYSLEHFADDIVAFMDAAGISTAVLVGSSSGGYVAQQVAITRPNRVAGLVLVDPRATFKCDLPSLTKSINYPTQWTPLG